MTHIQADKLWRTIEMDDPKCRVMGLRHDDSGYSLDVEDTRTGYPFVVSSPEEWQRRKEEAEE